MEIPVELLDKARMLVGKGMGRMKLEQEFGLTEAMATKLVAQVKMEQLLEDYPEILERVKQLVSAGETRFAIKHELNCSFAAAQYLISLAKEQMTQEEDQLEDPEERFRRQALRTQAETQKLNWTKKVARHMGLGHGAVEIASDLGLSRAQVEVLMREVKAERAMDPVRGKTEKDALLEHIEEEGGGAYRIAKALDCTIGTAQKIKKRANGTISPADDTVRNLLSKGTTLFTLMNKAGIVSHQEVLKVVKDLFPDCMLYTREIGGGNHSYTLIPDTSNHFDWLNANKEEKIFKWAYGKNGSFETGGDYLYVEINKDFPLDRLRIYQQTDQHIGSKHCDYDRLYQDIQRIKDDPHALLILTGDTIEWITKLSVGDISEQHLSPMEQVSTAAKAYMPVAHKIVLLRSGNHDRGRGKVTGTDLAEVLSYHLKVPYFRTETIVQINFGEELFTISVDHGKSGGSVQSILKDAEKYREYSAYAVLAHFSGHCHDSSIKPRIAKILIPGKGLEFKRTYTIVGGSYLKLTNSYAHESKFAPTPQDLQYLDIWQDGRYSAGSIEVDPK